MHDNITPLALGKTATRPHPPPPTISGTNQTDYHNTQPIPSPSTYSRNETIAAIAAITAFCTLYIRPPWVDPIGLVFPPAGGWFNINATELHDRGKSNEVIELLRHLPYIEHPSIRGGWTIDSESECIQYHKGVCYNDQPDAVKFLPGHVIPTADMVDRNGSYLLLDTETGKITSYNVMNNNIGGKWDEHEKLAEGDKLRAFPTMPVKQFFERWKMLYEKLKWMVAPPVDDSHGDRGSLLDQSR